MFGAPLTLVEVDYGMTKCGCATEAVVEVWSKYLDASLIDISPPAVNILSNIHWLRTKGNGEDGVKRSLI